MRTIDYLSVFFLLGAAPAWQVSLDAFSNGLGSALLITLLIGAIRASRADVKDHSSSKARNYQSKPSQKHI